MDLSSLLKGLSPSVIKLMEEKGIMEIPLEEEGLKALLTYDGEMLNASVFDSEGERYVLFDMDPPGAFVAKLREEVKAKTEEALGIRTPESTLALREKVISLFSERFGISDTYPWKDDNKSAVWRAGGNRRYHRDPFIKTKGKRYLGDTCKARKKGEARYEDHLWRWAFDR